MNNIYPIELIPDTNNSILVEIYCNDVCNYNCFYCSNLKVTRTRTNILIDLDQITNFISWLLNKTLKNILLELLGGEPTLHPKFKDFLLQYKDNKTIMINIFSNFTAPIEYYHSTLSNNINYLLTYHYNNSNREKEFIEKLDHLLALNPNNIENLKIIVMMVSKHVKECIKMYDFILNKYKNIDIILGLLDDFDKDTLIETRLKYYSDDDLKLYEERCKTTKIDNNIRIKYSDNSVKNYNWYEIKNDLDLNFKYWKCSAGRNFFSIDFRGNIYPCPTMKKLPLGNIKDYHNLKLHDVICRSSACCSFSDVNILKIFKLK